MNDPESKFGKGAVEALVTNILTAETPHSGVFLYILSNLQQARACGFDSIRMRHHLDPMSRVWVPDRHQPDLGGHRLRGLMLSRVFLDSAVGRIAYDHNQFHILSMELQQLKAQLRVPPMMWVEG